MSNVEIVNGQIIVGDKTISLISGEMHYWRVDPDNWITIFDSIKDLGIETIATYVPWQHHEVSAGNFDFHGKTRRSRDLIGFLDAVMESGLSLLIRPGPYIYAEWLNAGVPDRVIPFNKLHEKFIEAATIYIEAVVKTIRPYLATNGGPIVALQADNNIESFDVLYDEQLGLSGGIGLFQEYLQETYVDVSKLNEAWSTCYNEFSDAKGFSWPLSTSQKMMRRSIDTQLFRWWYSNRYAKWCKQCYLDAGIDVPIYFNGFKSLNKEQNLADLAEIGDFSGINVYPKSDFNSSPDEHRRTLEDMRHVCAYNPIPYIAEFQAGNCHGFHYSRSLPHPNHYRLLTFSAMLAGITAWNWFMLVSRDVWYGSPITEWGHKNLELFNVFKKLTRIARSLNHPRMKKLASSSIVLKDIHYIGQPSSYDDSVTSAFYEAGVDYEFFDPKRDRNANPILFYSGCSWLTRLEQKRLLEYVEQGGIMVFFQMTFPQLNESFEPLNILGISEPSHVIPKLFVDHFDTDIVFELGDTPVTISRPSPLCIYEATGAEEQILARGVPSAIYDDSSGEWSGKLTKLACRDELCIGYSKQIGKGRIMVLGVKPNPNLILAIHKYFKLPVYARVDTPRVQVGIFEIDKENVIIAVNNGSEAKEIVVKIDDSYLETGNYLVENLVDETEERIEIGTPCAVHLYMPAKDGVIIKMRRV